MASSGRNYLPLIGRSTTGVFSDRLPVQELAANHPHQWSLFVLGFAYIKHTPIQFPGVVQPPFRDSTSFMEIAAIHGKPYREWPGDRRTPSEAEIDFSYQDKKDMNPFPPRFGGYCHHAAVTFPSWHRPYVMLVEQAIGEYAENVAQQIENSHPGEVGRWVDAAKQLRMPYWDWADPRVDTEGLPSLFYTDELTIIGTGQRSVNVPNPLASYTLPYIPYDFVDHTRAGLVAYFSEWEKTYRFADSSPNPIGSNIEQLQATLKLNAKSVRDKVGMLFTFPDEGNPGTTYDEFSNTRNESRQEGQRSHTESLEGVHNGMHGNLGGNGHMGWPDYAAFDPIFYFHHCNVDRLAALWDWCYPDYWMGTGYTIDGAQQKWTFKTGSYSSAYQQLIEDEEEWGQLVPFRHPDGTYWTSKETRFFTPEVYPKYYSYKDFLGVEVRKGAANLQERQEARARIARYYNVDPQKDVLSIDAPYWKHITVPDGDKVDLPAGYQPIKNFRIFKVLVRLAEHAIDGSYNFNLYYKEELVGSVTVFARENTSPCKACAVRREADSIVRGVITIPVRIINDILVHSGVEPSKNTMDLTINQIAQALSAKLADVNGNVFASAQGGAVAAPPPPERAAPRTIHPVEVALLSFAVAAHQDKNLPVHFFDWQRHLDVFSSGWETIAPVAR